MGSMQLLHALGGKNQAPQLPSEGRMFVLAKIQGKENSALLDTGESHNFIEVKFAKELGIKITEEAGTLKAVNSEPKLICGIARKVEMCLGDWQGTIDLSLVPMDDYPLVLGMEFLDRYHEIPIVPSNTLVFVDGRKMHSIPVMREGVLKFKTLSA